MQTNLYEKMENHVKTPLQEHVLRQMLQIEQYEKDTQEFYNKNIDMYADVYLANENNRKLIND